MVIILFFPLFMTEYSPNLLYIFVAAAELLVDEYLLNHCSSEIFAAAAAAAKVPAAPAPGGFDLSLDSAVEFLGFVGDNPGCIDCPARQEKVLRAARAIHAALGSCLDALIRVKQRCIFLFEKAQGTDAWECSCVDSIEAAERRMKSDEDTHYFDVWSADPFAMKQLLYDFVPVHAVENDANERGTSVIVRWYKNEATGMVVRQTFRSMQHGDSTARVASWVNVAAFGESGSGGKVSSACLSDFATRALLCKGLAPVNRNTNDLPNMSALLVPTNAGVSGMILDFQGRVALANGNGILQQRATSPDPTLVADALADTGDPLLKKLLPSVKQAFLSGDGSVHFALIEINDEVKAKASRDGHDANPDHVRDSPNGKRHIDLANGAGFASGRSSGMWTFASSAPLPHETMKNYTARCFPSHGAAGRCVTEVLQIDLPALLRFIRDGLYVEPIVVAATRSVGDVTFTLGVGGKKYSWLTIKIGGTWYCIKGVWIWILCFAPGIVAHPKFDGGVGYAISGDGAIKVFNTSSSSR